MGVSMPECRIFYLTICARTETKQCSSSSDIGLHKLKQREGMVSPAEAGSRTFHRAYPALKRWAIFFRAGRRLRV